MAFGLEQMGSFQPGPKKADRSTCHLLFCIPHPNPALAVKSRVMDASLIVIFQPWNIREILWRWRSTSVALAPESPNVRSLDRSTQPHCATQTLNSWASSMTWCRRCSVLGRNALAGNMRRDRRMRLLAENSLLGPSSGSGCPWLRTQRRWY